MQGFKTFIVAGFMAIAPALFQYLNAVDWNTLFTSMHVPIQFVVPLTFAIGAAVQAGMRSITTTPPGTQK